MVKFDTHFVSITPAIRGVFLRLFCSFGCLSPWHKEGGGMLKVLMEKKLALHLVPLPPTVAPKPTLMFPCGSKTLATSPGLLS
ncbi:unnamed protein product [Hydatigera taeniaeformis]|uniref:Uncharacterized protein n=1 Tax=Hydatigena taeniaeformis TaxID=6205 RepID=A0A0R3X453_HYDTA|nr:unnamed protein product [Hydatigera taeniaeformis]